MVRSLPEISAYIRRARQLLGTRHDCQHCQNRLHRTPTDLQRFRSERQAENLIFINSEDLCPVLGYPTLLWLENGKKIDKYSGPRSLDDLKAYIEQRGSADALPPKEEKKEGEGVAVLQLTTENFSTHVETGVTFIKFFGKNWNLALFIFLKQFCFLNFSSVVRPLQTNGSRVAAACWKVCWR